MLKILPSYFDSCRFEGLGTKISARAGAGEIVICANLLEDVDEKLVTFPGGRQIAGVNDLDADVKKLQEQFDRQIKRTSLFGGPAKSRYWDMYRDRQVELVRDPEKAFRKLFGEVFAEAYEEQLQRLRAKGRNVDD